MIQEYIGTGYVVNPSHTKILLIHHKKFNKWLPPGGHCNENEAPHEAAFREVAEETGIEARFVAGRELGLHTRLEEEVPNPAFVIKEFIEGKFGKGEDHYHIDFIYLMEHEEIELSIKEEEIIDAGWFGRDEIITLQTFPGVLRIVNKILK